MSNHDNEFPDGLGPAADWLRTQHAEVDTLKLDLIKQRVLTRTDNERRFGFVKSRIATVATIFALAGGTGGALAVAAGNGGNSSNSSGASGQYKPGWGCGDTNHTHTGPPGNPNAQSPCK